MRHIVPRMVSVDDLSAYFEGRGEQVGAAYRSFAPIEGRPGKYEEREPSLDAFTRQFLSPSEQSVQDLSWNRQDGTAALLEDIMASPIEEAPSSQIEDALMAAKELVSSEQVYLDKLYAIKHEFVDRLEAWHAMDPSLDDSMLQRVFRNVVDLYALHCELYTDLANVAYEGHQDEAYIAAVAQTLLGFTDYFRMYAVYSLGHAEALQALSVACRRRSVFRLVKISEAICGHTLQSLLINPIQRIPRYRLLLQRVRAVPLQREALDVVGQALAAVEALADELEHNIVQSEARNRVVHVQNTIFGGKIELVAAWRYCVRMGPAIQMRPQGLAAKLLPRRSRLVILLNDLLLIATAPRAGKRARLKQMLPLSSMQTTTLTEDTLQVTCRDLGTQILLQLPSKEEGAAWARDVASAIAKLREAEFTRFSASRASLP